MFIVVNRSKIVTYMISLLAVFVLLFATANLDEKHIKKTVETSANLVENQNSLTTYNGDDTNEDNNTKNNNYEI